MKKRKYKISLPKQCFELFGKRDLYSLNKAELSSLIKKMFIDNELLKSHDFESKYKTLFLFLKKTFGSWKNILKESDVNYKDISNRLTNKWTKENISKQILKMDREDLYVKTLKEKYSGLYQACVREFGSVLKAYKEIGINYEEFSKKTFWNKERVINNIIELYNLNIPLNSGFICKYYSNLRNKAELFFGSWGSAVTNAGFNYEEIKSKSGWGITYLSKDGLNYCSQTEGKVADILFDLKNKGVILGYERQVLVTSVKKWTCDFKILFNNGFKLLLEVDGLLENRNHGGPYNENHPKIHFYIKNKYPYEIVSSLNQISSLIEKYNNKFSIPLKNSIITSHKNPDGDAISSCVSIFNYLNNNDIFANIVLKGTIPKNLEWMVNNINTDEDFILDDIEQIIVLDSSPDFERIGWELPKNIPIINIDHHVSRIDQHNPNNNVYVIDACSTALILLRWFGIEDNILAVGAYTDTYFSKNIMEVLCFLSDLGISDEEIEDVLDKVSFRTDRKSWHIIRDSKIHNCRNNFIIIETNEDNLSAIESALFVLMKFNESICLIFGKEKNVKLRTSNKLLDVANIAKVFGGNGHPFAAVCNVKDRVSEFKDYIIHYNVER